jgi:hypothetical protein
MAGWQQETKPLNKHSMNTLLSNWHFMRLLRAGIAVWAIHEAWSTSQWLLLVPGGIFAVQAIFDIGCCGAAGCAPTQTRNTTSSKTEDITYEEVR